MVRLLTLLAVVLSLSFGVEIISETLYTDTEGNVIAEGNVSVDYGVYTIEAQKIKYDPKERTVFAQGEVIVKKKDGTFEVVGTEAFIDLKTDKGYFLDAKGRFRSFYFSAERIEKTGKERYVIERGDITTCPPEDKELKLCFRKAKVSGKYVVSFSDSLRFFGVPVLYTPLAVFPVGERRSGLLPPLLGQDSYNTFIYIQPFFWALSRDRDATFTLDYRDKQAKGGSVEYRQAFTEKDSLYLKLSYYAEPSPPGEWWKGRSLQAFRENRYRIELKTSLGRWKLGLDVPSDPYFLEDFYFSRKERTLPYTLSYITYVRTEEDYLLSFNLRSFYDLTSSDNRKALSLLPEIGFYSRPKRVGPLFVSLTSSFSNFYREEGERSKRLLFIPEFELPLKLLGFNNYSSLKVLNNFYFTDGSPSQEDRVTSFRFENRLPLFKSFKFFGFNLSNVLELVYAFSPENFDNPQFDSFDQVTKENNFKFRLSSSAFKGSGVLGNLFLEGGYNLLKSYRFPTDSELVEKELLPLRLILSFHPTGWITVSEDLTYDANLGILARGVSSVNLNLGKSRFGVSYVTSKDSRGRRLTDQYTLGTEVKLRGLLFGGSATFDNITDRELRRNLYAGYSGACWTFKVDYRRTYYASGKGTIHEVFLVFTVFNLRDFKLPLRRR